MKVRAVIVAMVALAWASAWAHAHLPKVYGVSVFDRGQYRAVSAGLSPSIGSMGPVHSVHSAQLVAATMSIPARQHVRFGLRYVVEGVPRGTMVDIRMVTRFPAVGLVEPTSGQRIFSREYRQPVQLGLPGYRDYALDEDWEVVPGRWLFEFWIGDRKLKEQEFCLFDPAKAVGTVCPIGPTTQPRSRL
jgi:hypothetical protein